jgi:hypothetical protein
MLDTDRIAELKSNLSSFNAGFGATDPRLLLGNSFELSVYWAPFDHINRDARIVLVGITPGQYQAEQALKTYRAARLNGIAEAEALKIAKSAASFSGPMRKNLTRMLDSVGVAQKFGLQSSATLFKTSETLAHFTSALRYPVFRHGENYNGRPGIDRVHMLTWMIDTYLGEEVEALPDALWVPLGDKPGVALDRLVAQGKLDPDKVLSGFPHPSGANNGPISRFLRGEAGDAYAQRAQALREKLSMPR